MKRVAITYLLLWAAPIWAGTATVHKLGPVSVMPDQTVKTAPVNLPANTSSVSWSYAATKPVLASVCTSTGCQDVAGARGRLTSPQGGYVSLSFRLPKPAVSAAKVHGIQIIASAKNEEARQ